MTATLSKFSHTDVLQFDITSNAAKEVVEARILLGIHFHFADTAARLQGERVTKFVEGHFLGPVGQGRAELPDGD